MKALSRRASDEEILRFIDLTATFAIIESPDRLLIRLGDIHVM